MACPVGSFIPGGPLPQNLFVGPCEKGGEVGGLVAWPLAADLFLVGKFEVHGFNRMLQGLSQFIVDHLSFESFESLQPNCLQTVWGRTMWMAVGRHEGSSLGSSRQNLGAWASDA